MMKLRIMAILLALTLMIGEAIRSWGIGRPFYSWFDDQIMGAALIVGAILMAKPTPKRQSFFVAAWAFNVGMLYPSFFGKIIEPENSNPGNFDLGFLTLAVGVLFGVAIVGTVMSIANTGNDGVGA